MFLFFLNGLESAEVMTCHLDDCTNRAACDNAGTLGSRTHQNCACTELTSNLVGNCGSLEGDLVKILLSVLETLADSVRNFVGFAHAEAYNAVAVADNYQSGELHDTSALNGLGNAVYSNNFLVELVIVCV